MMDTPKTRRNYADKNEIRVARQQFEKLLNEFVDMADKERGSNSRRKSSGRRTHKLAYLGTSGK